MKKSTFFLIAACAITIGAYAQAPTITSFSPASGPVGTLVTINGTNLNTPTAFTIGGVAAIVVSDNGTSLVGIVMPGTASGNVSVTTSAGTAIGGNYAATPTLYPSTQQGNKLTGTGSVGSSDQGTSVAVSADGNTAIVGGPADVYDSGAVWIFTRTAGVWAQQGPKLVGSDIIHGPDGSDFGYSVAISADGNTALVGGHNDNTGNGAVWFFTRTAGVWSQQGPKVVPPSIRNISFGLSVALSADGNTALVGSALDSSGLGGTYVYERSAGVWSQQGPKLIGSGAIGAPNQGVAVSISADGNTAVVGGVGDNSDTGAVWFFVRSGGGWSQQGPKMVGTGAVNEGNGVFEGSAVALSADGNTAVVGATRDANDTGAVWIFVRSGGVWSQQGPKLVGNDISNSSYAVFLGNSVSISADGNVVIAGGPADGNSGDGAAWVFARSGGVWTQPGPKLYGTGANGAAWQGNGVAISSDGSTAVVGGYVDGNVTLSLSIGATWIYVPALCAPDSSVSYDTIRSTALPYIWNGVTFASAGSQTVHLAGSAGCDSTTTLVLTVDSVLGISNVNGLSAIHLYPNPNRGSFTLQTANSIGSSYTISDMLGSVIAQQAISSDIQVIDLPEAGEGVYTLVVKGSPPVRFVIVR